MHNRKTAFIAFLCMTLMTLGRAAPGDTLQVQISATATELGGAQPDVFDVSFTANHDVRIQKITYDMTFANKALHFNTTGPGSFDFAVLASSSPVGATAVTADGSPHLVINFTDFQPGETLVFGIDIDAMDSTTWSAADFAGTHLDVLIDPSPAFPTWEPIGLLTQFQNIDGKALASVELNTPVPEPASCVLLTAGGLLLAAGRRLRQTRVFSRAGRSRPVESHAGTDRSRKRKGHDVRKCLGILLAALASLGALATTVGAADLLVVDDSAMRAFFGFYGSHLFADQPEKLWDDTVKWAVGAAAPGATHVLLFTYDGTLSDNDPANTDAIGFSNLLVSAGYQVQVDSRLDFATRTDYTGFQLVVFPNFGYSDAGAPSADNVISAEIPFITMEPGQTDELQIGTGVTVFHGTLTQAVVVDNNHVVTDAYGLGDVIPFVNISPPPIDVPTDGIKSSGRGRVLIGDVPEPGTIIFLTIGALVGAARLRRRKT